MDTCTVTATRPNGIIEETPLEKEVERVLGDNIIPDGADLKATEKGSIVATLTNALGTVVTLEITNKGKVYSSRICSKKEQSFESKEKDGMRCVSYPKREQPGYTFAPKKVEEARKLILKACQPAK